MVTINTESALTPRPLRDTRRFWYYLLDHHKLGVEHDYWRDLPDSAR